MRTATAGLSSASPRVVVMPTRILLAWKARAVASGTRLRRPSPTSTGYDRRPAPPMMSRGSTSLAWISASSPIRLPSATQDRFSEAVMVRAFLAG